MKRIIQNIRSKPAHLRDRYVWIIAGAVTLLLLATWLIVGNGHKSSPDDTFFQNFNQGLNEGKNTFDANAFKQP